jgi:DUF177 domain-containing protein
LASLEGEAEPGHHHEQIDPRWAKLAGMLDQDDK